MTWYEIAQAWIAGATLPVTAVFLILFARPSEKWWATWFGRSLFLLALGVFAYSSATVLWRAFGDYPGRPAVLVLSTTLVFVAMVIRTAVLWQSQRHGKRFPSLGDAVTAVEALRAFEELARHVEHLTPCPDPACVAVRARMVDIAHRLPTHDHR